MDANTTVIKILEVSDKNFKPVIIRMPQLAYTNILKIQTYQNLWNKAEAGLRNF